MKHWLLVTLFLVSCGSEGAPERVATNNADPWPIQVLIRVENYIHTDAIIDGVVTDCVFDTGAPGGLYLPNGGRVVAVVGNYERTLDANLLWPEATFLDCIIGMRFFEGMSEYFINLETSELLIR
jgi:hypothetical protein